MAPRPCFIVAAFALAPVLGACAGAPLYPRETAAACHAGVGTACVELGTALRSTHPMRARAFLTAGCDAGHAESCAALADMVLRGEGAPPSRTFASKILHAACAAERGSRACAALADLEATWVDAVSVGRAQTCVLTTGAAIWCWGRNDQGQCGQDSPEVQVGRTRYGAETAVLRPRRVLLGGEDRPATALSVGTDHACALDHRGEVWCWGDGSRYGTLGLGAPTSAWPIQVVTEPEMIFRGAHYGWIGPPLRGARDVVAGACYSCALLRSGKVACWGCSRGYWDDAAAVRVTPDLDDGLMIAGGAHEACVLTRRGGITCGLPDSPRVLEEVPPLVVGLAVGEVPLAVTADGLVWLWPSVGEVPTQLAVPPAIAIRAWGDRACLRSAEGQVSCGWLGDGALVGLASVDAFGAATGFDVPRARAGAHSCAVTGEGRVVCAGANDWGQLGVGDREPHSGAITITLPGAP